MLHDIVSEQKYCLNLRDIVTEKMKLFNMFPIVICA